MGGCGGAEDSADDGNVGAESAAEVLGDESPVNEEGDESTVTEVGDESVVEEVGDESTSEEGGAEEGGEALAEEGGEAIEEEGPDEPEIVDGVPAPGALCPIPEPWGSKVGDNLQNMAFKDCAGNDVTLWDMACGSSVSWVYFTYGW